MGAGGVVDDLVDGISEPGGAGPIEMRSKGCVKSDSVWFLLRQMDINKQHHPNLSDLLDKIGLRGLAVY